MRTRRSGPFHLSYRCSLAKGRETVPLFGEYGLANQSDSLDYALPRKFREKMDGWLRPVRAMWLACPARIAEGGSHLVIDNAVAVLPGREHQLNWSRA
jgi:hypothetical protein